MRTIEQEINCFEFYITHVIHGPAGKLCENEFFALIYFLKGKLAYVVENNLDILVESDKVEKLIDTTAQLEIEKEISYQLRCILWRIQELVTYQMQDAQPIRKSRYYDDIKENKYFP